MNSGQRKTYLIKTFIFVVLALANPLQAHAASSSDTSREYHLKAAFLRYVAQFVTWPEEFMPESEINICLLGEIPSLQGLNSINGRIVNNKPILVRPIKDLEIAKKECQILFITQSEEKRLSEIISVMKDLPVLTFGDMEGFAEAGGDMNFYVANNRMAIMINQQSVVESKLEIHPRMLKLVTIIPKTEDLKDS